MPFPQPAQYNEAIQNLRTSVSDEELRQGEPHTNALGVPMPYSGGFADVYRVHCPQTGNTWAVKCFTRDASGLRERYREISRHLQQVSLPFMVDFEFQERGIRIGRDWHPLLKMRWVEGFSLNQFVLDHLDETGTLKRLLELWLRLSVLLREARIAHADLQYGNVLLVPVPGTERLGLKLIDYDGMWVPALAARKSGEAGHAAFQHPQRQREGLYNAEVDRFSHLAIYTALRSLIVGRRALWQRFDNGENLLFRELDYRDPANSEVFRALWDLRDPEVHSLVGRLALGCRMPLDQVPWLDQIVSDGQVRPLSPAEQRDAAAVLGSPSRPVQVPRPSPAVSPQLGSSTVSRGSPTPQASRSALGANASSAAVRVVVTCRCGQSFQAAPHLYGQRVSCSVCRAPLDIPHPQAADSAVEPLDDLTPVDDLWTAELPPPPRVPPRPLARRPTPRPRAVDPLSELGDFLRRNWRPVSVISASVVASGLLLSVASWAFRGRAGNPDVPAPSALIATEETAGAATDESTTPPVSPETASTATDESTTPPVSPETSSTASTPAPSALIATEETAGAATDESTTPPVSPETASTASAPAPASQTLTNSIGVKLVLIAPGEFLMGSPQEMPQHRVQITKLFYLGVYEVTQAQYQKVVGNNPSKFKGESLPVETVSWKDAVAFCKRLSEVAEERAAGRTYRLPTEAEWEYACRAGSTSKYSFGDSEAELGKHAWYKQNSDMKTHPVGKKQPNVWGLYDMHGNVFEWCQDGDGGYEAGPASDPSGPDSATRRVLRGGSGEDGGWFCRSAFRFGSVPGDRKPCDGFRVALVQSDAS